VAPHALPRWSRDQIAARVARDITPGSVVNLGIGAPTLMWKNPHPRRSEAWPEAGRSCKRDEDEGIRRRRAWR
jgi:hypothetical protein